MDDFLDRFLLELALLRGRGIVAPIPGGFERGIEDTDLVVEEGFLEIDNRVAHSVVGFQLAIEFWVAMSIGWAKMRDARSTVYLFGTHF